MEEVGTARQSVISRLSFPNNPAVNVTSATVEDRTTDEMEAHLFNMQVGRWFVSLYKSVFSTVVPFTSIAFTFHLIHRSCDNLHVEKNVTYGSPRTGNDAARYFGPDDDGWKGQILRTTE